MNYILFDEPTIRTALLPFTFTRPVADIRMGIWTITEKWENWLKNPVSHLTESYLQPKFPHVAGTDNLYINGAVCPTDALVAAIRTLTDGQALLTTDQTLIAVRTSYNLDKAPNATGFFPVPTPETPVILRQLPDIFALNGDQIRADFARITAGRTSAPMTDPHTAVYGAENLFIEEGATIRASVLNAEGGPIYIGKNATISEGTTMIGPFALCDNSTVNWGGKMRSNTTIGPFCKVGGEVGNSVFFGYSNKAHDGFLGNSVIGEWCNLGANVNNSNLKNDYTNVKLHSYATDQLEDTGRLFCGLMMGDFTKSGISTLFNTGTVVGVNVNVFGAGFQPKHIPSFSWGGAAEGFSDYRLDKAMYVARETVGRRGLPFGLAEEALLTAVYEATRGPQTNQ
ncbi:putative sugar nucleotidyl transferase [Fibrella forsythiae]|uniref:Glucose-1-phosphate thymidylyltransferase n=1 Tax=Fibrella forsythiae TaxID=2817061 RepID=A0ABS3JPG6_9BACT|nr:putative sugar nucleotidyl transferase [Fibrella forsythiae]MBO0951894.1 glucose-1-phosphate thymidylyltransferase [Fibrella forsythiae]